MTSEAEGPVTGLLPHHAELVRASGINETVAQARGYRSVTVRSELERMGFTKPQRNVPALLVPVWNVNGQIANYQIRPDQPRIDKRGKLVKYETPGKSTMVIDVPPTIRDRIGDPRVPLFVTEGVRKADAAVSIGLCCIGILGVWNWRGTNEHGGKTALPDWESIALRDRIVYVVFDGDAVTKREVYRAMKRLGALLASKGASVRFVLLPATAEGQKVGLDDFLAAGRNVDDLLSRAVEELPAPPGNPTDDAEYFASADGIFRRKQTLDGFVLIQLTNFSAEIVGDIREDDGVEVRRLFEIEATLGERRAILRIPSAQFAGLAWATEHLGAQAIVMPGMAIRDHARAAIQLLSTDPDEETVYSHIGWREIDGAAIYLHAAGGIGSSGSVTHVSVAPPDALAPYSLPAPPVSDHLVEVVRASLRFLDLAPRRTTLPILSAVYRAPLGAMDFSMHVSGETGRGKTALAVVAQQHYGAGLDDKHLPGSWTSTGNALEAIAFAAKDALFLIDDFVPRGTNQDVARLQREAERILRAQGNSSGRQRLRADASLRPTKPPRGLILSTGEDIPRGHSLRARLLILEVEPQDLSWGRLTASQQDAGSGLLAESMSGYLHWLAPQVSSIRKRLASEIDTLRTLANRTNAHRRTPSLIASLALGFRYFLDYAVASEALSRTEADQHWKAGWAQLLQVGVLQARYHEASEPTTRFRELLAAAIAGGQAHVAAISGDAPSHPESWGWRRDDSGSTLTGGWRAYGTRIGWLDDDNLYLEPESAFAVAQDLARGGSDTLAISSRTLHRRLFEHSLLVSTESLSRQTLTVRRSIQAERRAVLHLHARTFLFAGPDQPDQDGSDTSPGDPEPWSGPRSDSDQTDPQPDQDGPGGSDGLPADSVPKTDDGQFGQVAQVDKAADPARAPHTERFEL